MSASNARAFWREYHQAKFEVPGAWVDQAQALLWSYRVLVEAGDENFSADDVRKQAFMLAGMAIEVLLRQQASTT